MICLEPKLDVSRRSKDLEDDILHCRIHSILVFIVHQKEHSGQLIFPCGSFANWNYNSIMSCLMQLCYKADRDGTWQIASRPPTVYSQCIYSQITDGLNETFLWKCEHNSIVVAVIWLYLSDLDSNVITYWCDQNTTSTLTSINVK